MDGHRFEPRTSINACGHVCRYMDRKGLAAMLTSIQSVGVAPEVNLRNSLHAGNKACKRRIHSGFETQGRRRQKSKTGVSVAPRKGFMSSKTFLKKRYSRLSMRSVLSGVHEISLHWKICILYYTIVDPYASSILYFQSLTFLIRDQHIIAQNMLTIVYWRFSDVEL